MLKIKSRSLVVGESMGPELRDHVAMLIEREEDHMRFKLQRQTAKQARIQAMEREFVEWADQKESRIRQKLQKSGKNKEEYLGKIVKKCKDHEKFLNQKYKIFQTKKKANIKAAWKKAEQLNHSIENQQHSKQVVKDQGVSKQRSQASLTQSRHINQKYVSLEKQASKEYIAASYNNGSKNYNASKDYWTELNQSFRPFKLTEPPYQKEQMREDTREEAPKTPLEYKLKQTIARCKQNIKQSEEEKIQQLGQRLEKIQKSRTKKIELHKKKKEDRDHFLDTQQNFEKKNKKQKVERSQRVHSEAMINEKRVHDWSESNKQKRDQRLQAHLQHGNEYLQNQKLKYIKTTLAKKIALTAIEKKLYFERLNH